MSKQGHPNLNHHQYEAQVTGSKHINSFMSMGTPCSLHPLVFTMDTSQVCLFFHQLSPWQPGTIYCLPLLPLHLAVFTILAPFIFLITHHNV
ncbi:hypothetical protein E2C01_090090 [Portunus trituberculatus]|uniref:Uncharacterized protein n=1 Tax=Portunus trituberculatus TaxID=210409 RepID=A0A5B7JDS1_PORTR|nr:hypothetical protein [Portunus trituberculatus]